MSSCDALLATTRLLGTSFGESGKRVSIQPTEGEEIRFYRTDHDAFRRAFRLQQARVSDLAVDIREAQRTILFVELKGRHVDDAIEQLSSTIAAVLPCLHREAKGATLRAVVASSGSAPKRLAPSRRAFEKRFDDVKLIVKTCRHLDLRRDGCLA